MIKSKLNIFTIFVVVATFFIQISPVEAAKASGCAASLEALIAFTVGMGPDRGKSLEVSSKVSLNPRSLANSNDPLMFRTLLAVSLVNAMRTAIDAVSKKQEPHGLLVAQAPALQNSRVGKVLMVAPVNETARAQLKTTTLNQRIAEALRRTIDDLNIGAKDVPVTPDRKVKNFAEELVWKEAIAAAIKLASNIESRGDYSSNDTFSGGYGGYGGGSVMRGGFGGDMLSATRSMSFESTPRLNVTTGGQMDWGHAKSLINSGKIPTLEQLPVNAFLHEFHLGLPAGEGAEILRPLLGTIYDPESGRLYVQVSMTSDITPDSFKRPPVDLVVALDVSGSMDNTDGGKLARIERAKEALRRIADRNLNENDTLSIILFNHHQNVVLSNVKMDAPGKTKAIEAIKGIVAGGMTSIMGALSESVAEINFIRSEVAEESGSLLDNGRVQRVLFLSDVQPNEWSSTPSETAAFARSMVEKKIALTVVAIGNGFEGDFARMISDDIPGSTLVSVNDGAALEELVTNQFSLLMAPIAIDAMLMLRFNGLKIKPRLVYSYGVPSVSGTGSIQQLKSLFLVNSGAKSGGGAMVFVYDLNSSEVGGSSLSGETTTTGGDSSTPGGSFKLRKK